MPSTINEQGKFWVDHYRKTKDKQEFISKANNLEKGRHDSLFTNREKIEISRNYFASKLKRHFEDREVAVGVLWGKY